MDNIDRETEVFFGFWINTEHIDRFEEHLRKMDNDIKRVKKYYGIKVCFIYKLYINSIGRLEMSALTVTQNAAYKATRIDKELRCWHVRI